MEKYYINLEGGGKGEKQQEEEDEGEEEEEEEEQDVSYQFFRSVTHLSLVFSRLNATRVFTSTNTTK
ncbi:hypothetical protein E2C01_099248 [Portunus trituberculatus]|uniref:Uncharacterized protein n=1 Tax=Portunus trituberculatus TaxID=210409 RepID=A0A5B7K9V0_PORTR|nr:hypothetical protein [Portunus trituberculatus]